MKKFFESSIFLNALASFVVFVFALLFFVSNIGESFENKLYDSYIDLTASKFKPSEKIILVLLDQESLDWAKETRGWSWPWARKAYAEIVEYFVLANAKAVCFDVLFSENSVYGEVDDLAFAEACRNYNRAIQVMHFVKRYDKYSVETKPIKLIEEATPLCASVMSATDKDGVVRRARLGVQDGENFFPTLGLSPLFIEKNFNNKEYNITKIIDEYSIPILKDETIYLRYQKSINDFVPYNAAQILQSFEAIKNNAEPLLEPENFSDCIIFFGFYAPGLFDLVATPTEKNYPGVGVHLTMLDTILNKNYIRATPFYLQIVILVFLIVCSIFVFNLSKSKKTQSKVLVLKIAISFLFFVVFIFCVSLGLFYFGIYLKTANIFFAVLLSFIASILIFYTVEGKQKRFIKKAFTQYLSTAVVEELIANPEKLTLGGVRREISIFFSDLQGFTSISESLDPTELTSLLNDYLSLMSDIILNSGGTIDKYEGDAIIAFWNAPLEKENHAALCLQAALDCQKVLAEHREEFSKRANGKPFKMRIGLNTGLAVVGNMGSKHRFDYTMLGDSVNLSARLEGINKIFGTFTLCTEASKLQCEKMTDKIKFREVGKIMVVGKSEAVKIFEPMTSLEYETKKDLIKNFDTALQLFYAGKLSDAKEKFTKLENDEVSKKYIAFCEKYLEAGIVPEGGVIKATEK